MKLSGSVPPWFFFIPKWDVFVTFVIFFTPSCICFIPFAFISYPNELFFIPICYTYKNMVWKCLAQYRRGVFSYPNELFLYFCLFFYFWVSLFILCAEFSYLFGMKKWMRYEIDWLSTTTIPWYKFTQKKKVQFKGPVTTRVCDGWRWQRMLAVEACRVTWRWHQLWWPRAETQSVQRQHPPRVWRLCPARHPALQPRHSRRGRSRRNPWWTATTTTQGLTTTPRACIRPHVQARVGWRSYVRNRVCGETQCCRVVNECIHTMSLVMRRV